MKNFYTLLFFILLCTIVKAQTFEFGISYIGINPVTDNYQMVLTATPNTSVTNEITADMGAGLYVPSGVTLGNFETGNSGIPSIEWSSASLSNTSSAFFLSRVEASSSSVLLNGAGPFELVKFDVIADPNPSTGEILFVENGDSVFDELLFIENYINLSSSNKYSQNDPIAKSVNFSTLSKSSSVLNIFSIHPNPTKNIINISGNISNLKSIGIYSITGKPILNIEKGFEEIDISHLESSIYFITLNSENNSKTFKIIKE